MATDLITKLEEAGEGSRALDGAICLLLSQQPEWATKHCAPRQPELWTDGKPGTWAREWLSPRYTTSLDAALALAERVIKVRGPIDMSIMGSAQVVILAADPCANALAEVTASTPALALCAAILRASEQERGG